MLCVLAFIKKQMARVGFFLSLFYGRREGPLSRNTFGGIICAMAVKKSI